MLFHIPHNIFKLFAMRTDDHVDMAGHDTPAIYFKPFFGLAMSPAFKHDVFVFITDKQVYPVYYRKTNKVKPVLIVEFIFCAHGSLKVHYKRHNAKRTNIYSVYLSAGHENSALLALRCILISLYYEQFTGLKQHLYFHSRQVIYYAVREANLF